MMLRIRHGASVLALLLALFPFYILIIAAQDVGQLEMINCKTTLELPIIVSSVYLTCDSSGAYYYGKSSYHGSKTCVYGDTANVVVYLELQQDFSNDSILVSIDDGLYGVLSPAIEAADFCTMATLSTSTNNDDDDDDDDDNNNNNAGGASDEDSSDCLTTGFYSLKTSFTVSSFDVDQNFNYVPDLRLRFYNSSMAVIGCAHTGTSATYDHAATHAEMGMMALGIGLLVLGTCFGLMIYLAYRRKKRMEQEAFEQKMRQDLPYVRTTLQGRVLVPYTSGRPRSDIHRLKGTVDV